MANTMNNRQLLTAIANLPEDDRWAAVCELAAARARRYPALVVAKRIWGAIQELCEEHGIGPTYGNWDDGGSEGMAYAPPTDQARALVREYDRRKTLAWRKRQAEKEPPPELNLKPAGDSPAQGEEPPPF